MLTSVMSGTVCLKIPAVELHPLMNKEMAITARRWILLRLIRENLVGNGKITGRVDKSQESCTGRKKYFGILPKGVK